MIFSFINIAHTWLASFPEIIESKISDLFNFVFCLSVLNVVNYPTFNEKSSHMDECAVQQWKKMKYIYSKEKQQWFREDFEGINGI